MSDPTPQQVLDLPIAQNHPSGATTIRGYLIALLLTVWNETASTKRPFGTTDWPFDLYKPLLTAGYVDGQFDRDGDIKEVDGKTADRLIAAAINSLGEWPPARLVPGNQDAV